MGSPSPNQLLAPSPHHLTPHHLIVLVRCYNDPMSISLDEVRHVAKLARLQLDEAEILALQGELNALLGHFADIQALNVDGIEPQSHAVAVQNIWGADDPEIGLDREDVLRNAPISKAGLFVVPTIIED